MSVLDVCGKNVFPGIKLTKGLVELLNEDISRKGGYSVRGVVGLSVYDGCSCGQAFKLNFSI